MKKLFIWCFLLVVSAIQVYAQISTIAGWGVVALGNDRNHLSKIEGNSFATLILHNEQLVFSLWKTETQQSLGPSILLHNLYLDQNAAEGKSFIGMKSTVNVLGGQSKKGILYLSLSKDDGGNDIIHFDFGIEHLYIVGYLLDEKMVSRITKLAGIGTVIENGGKPKMPLSKMLEE